MPAAGDGRPFPRRPGRHRGRARRRPRGCPWHVRHRRPQRRGELMALDLPAASRESLADLASRLDVLVDQVGPAELDAFGDELFAVTRLLAAQIGLRRHLADPSVPESARTDVVERLLAGKVQRPALETVQAAAAARWSRSADLIDALQTLARTAVLASAGKTGRLDEAEDELFRFGRILDREPELARLLADPVTPIEGRIRLLDQLLSDKVTQTTATLLRQSRRATPRSAPRRAGRGAGRDGRSPPASLDSPRHHRGAAHPGPGTATRRHPLPALRPADVPPGRAGREPSGRAWSSGSATK